PYSSPRSLRWLPSSVGLPIWRFPSGSVAHPVASLVPRSTTVYRRQADGMRWKASLNNPRCPPIRRCRRQPQTKRGSPPNSSPGHITFKQTYSPDARGISSSSRWLSAATPPEQPPLIRTPAGVPASPLVSSTHTSLHYHIIFATKRS